MLYTMDVRLNGGGLKIRYGLVQRSEYRDRELCGHDDGRERS